MGRRRRRTPKKAQAPHPPLWPYLLGITVLLAAVAIAGTIHLRREQARIEQLRAEDARRRGVDSAAPPAADPPVR